MAQTPLLQLQDAQLAFGHVALLDSVDLEVQPGERLCLIGRNGTGKSTMLNVINAEQVLDGGQRWVKDGIGIAKLAQEVPDAAHETLFDVVAAGLGDHATLLSQYQVAIHDLETGGERAMQAFTDIQAKIEEAGAWEGSQRIDATLSRLRLDPDALMAGSSGGIRRRAMLGQAIVSEPDLLLLDEPTNHLDIESIDALEEALLAYPGTIVFITHDRTLMDKLATRIIELDRGQLRSYPGNYADYMRRKEAQLSAEADADRKFDKNLAQEEVWIRQGIKARRTRNEGRVRRLEAMRAERGERRNRTGQVSMAVSKGEASGKRVVEVEDVTFHYPAQDEVPPATIRDFSTLVLRGDRIGIIGPNGSGKSTLLKLMLGDLEPTVGTITRGTGLQVAYFDQERAQLDPNSTVRDNVGEGSDQIQVGNKTRHVISYLSDFLFPAARAQSPVKTLSGGERNRLLLAKLFAKPANLLVLDEPTNDLDMETLELLEELLSEFDGTLLLVSHDRSFLDRTVTSTLIVEENGHVEEHVGGYSDWHRFAQRRSQTKTNADPQKEPEKSASTAANKSSAPKALTKKLSFKEQQELAALPELIEQLEAAQTQAQRETSDPTFFKQDPDQVKQALEGLADVEQQLAKAYERWQTLEP